MKDEATGLLTIDVMALPDGKSIEIEVEGERNVYRVSDGIEPSCENCAFEDNEVICRQVSCCAGLIDPDALVSFRVSRAVVNASGLVCIAWIKVED